jgi:hypothetical protein
MPTKNPIEVTTDPKTGEKSATTIYRGSEYLLYMLCGEWFVAYRRLALGRGNVGGGRYYATLSDVAAGCKAFGSAEDLINMFYLADLPSQNIENK